MATPTIIIDGRSPSGKRLSISLDKSLWSLYVASEGNDLKRARLAIKQLMSSGVIQNTFQAKCWIYRKIARPELLKNLSDSHCSVEATSLNS